MRRVVVASLFSLIWIAPSIGGAQVSGTVEDENNQPVVGARVSLQASNTETVSDSNGDFTLPGLSGDVVVAAATKGYFYGVASVTAPATGVVLQLLPVPLEDDPAYVFTDSATCLQCHPQQYQEWNGSPMEKAGVNTWVYDIYDGSGTSGGMGGFVYTRDSEHRTAAPESECRSCHQPEGWATTPFTAMAPLNGPAADLHGITCEVCHKIANIDISKPNFPGLFPGVVTMTRPQTPGWTVQYGVLGDVSYEQAGTMQAAYNPQLRSEICAACHQDKNDHDLDGDFEDDGGVISEPTYLEWVNSPYGDPNDPMFADCVDCHMAPTQSPDACDINPTSLNRPEGDVRSHEILGTTAEFLENSVTMTVDAQEAAGELEVAVSIVNDQVGHHVPTGVTIRNMILLVEAFVDGDNTPLEHTGSEVVHDLGGVGDPAMGYYAGLPGRLFGKLNHDMDGNGPTFFTDATGIQFDNRIVALATDDSTYTFALPPEGGTVRVHARLIYRRSWRALVDAKGWTEDGHGNPLADVTAPHYGHLMEEAEVMVDVAAGCADPPCDPECTVDGDCPSGEVCVASVCEPAPAFTPPAEEEDDGCGCRVVGTPNSSRVGWLLPLLLLLGVARRRKARQLG
jgi:MYXO-CTERM domain-containing protein